MKKWREAYLGRGVFGLEGVAYTSSKPTMGDRKFHRWEETEKGAYVGFSSREEKGGPPVPPKWSVKHLCFRRKTVVERFVNWPCLPGQGKKPGYRGREKTIHLGD